MEKQSFNIFQRMAKATFDLGTVGKNLDVSTGGGTYKAVSERDVLNAVKKVEAEHGIYSYPMSRKVIADDVLISQTQKGEKRNLFMRVETIYRFVNIDKPDEFIDVVSYGDGVDPQDKAPGKAMTYSDKYALLKAYKIETGDDPDQEGSQEHNERQKRTEAKPAPKFASDALIDVIMERATGEQITEIQLAYGIKNVAQLTEIQANQVISILNLLVHPKLTAELKTNYEAFYAKKGVTSLWLLPVNNSQAIIEHLTKGN